MTAPLPDPRQEVRIIPAKPDARLDKHLADLCPDLSRSFIQKMIAEGRVRVNGRAVRAGYRMKASDVVVMEPQAEQPEIPEPRPFDLAILYEDAEVLVVDKPAGVPTHPGPGHGGGTLSNALLAYLPDLAEVGDPARPGIVHRLDKDTSGLLIVAKTADAHQDLSAQFKQRTVSKMYMALVEGLVVPPEGVIEAPLGRHLKRRKEMAVVQDGRQSTTKYETVGIFGGYTLLRVTPKTGRTHQVRVHMAAIGYPVVGDSVYGNRNKCLARHFLHAAYLRFRHPGSMDEIEVNSQLPGELSGFLNSLSDTGC